MLDPIINRITSELYFKWVGHFLRPYGAQIIMTSMLIARYARSKSSEPLKLVRTLNLIIFRDVDLAAPLGRFMAQSVMTIWVFHCFAKVPTIDRYRLDCNGASYWFVIYQWITCFFCFVSFLFLFCFLQKHTRRKHQMTNPTIAHRGAYQRRKENEMKI